MPLFYCPFDGLSGGKYCEGIFGVGISVRGRIRFRVDLMFNEISFAWSSTGLVYDFVSFYLVSVFFSTLTLSQLDPVKEGNKS